MIGFRSLSTTPGLLTELALMKYELAYAASSFSASPSRRPPFSIFGTEPPNSVAEAVFIFDVPFQGNLLLDRRTAPREQAAQPERGPFAIGTNLNVAGKRVPLVPQDKLNAAFDWELSGKQQVAELSM